MIKSINPSNGELIKEYESYSDNDVLSIVNQVSSGYINWKDTSFDENANSLFNISSSENAQLT